MSFPRVLLCALGYLISLSPTTQARAPAPPPRPHHQIDKQLQHAMELIQSVNRITRPLLGRFETDELKKEQSELLRRALRELTSLRQRLNSGRPCSSRDRDLLCEVNQQAACAHFMLGSYDEAIRLHEETVRYAPRAQDRMEALAGVVGCYAARSHLVGVRTTLRRMRELLSSLEPGPQRRHWEGLLEEAARQLRD